MNDSNREKAGINFSSEVARMHIQRANLLSLTFLSLVAFAAGNVLSSAAAQTSSGKWSYFKFQPGHFFLCTGIKGLLVNYTNKVFGRLQKRTYCVNSNIPLPIYARVPAANDTWTYDLVEIKGI